jgi:cysteinyl-tRNA synthetase
MISKLGEFATDGLRDPYEVFAPLMKVVMELRAKIRAAKQYDLADLLRDELGRIGIEIRDTRDGQEWVLNDPAD